ncbi:phosphatidylinositol 4-phosphate 5-kinase 9 isoform X1 [Physcomitrium patens]|uniref:phosphatidylinositol 4-phosphate 5-kinase 9 isoform X1 n=1 Tax=Physcomitrium patens TaxID=3218 RepID=UPI000D1696E8|nr:phosphatidylinositol 4-phosphate 5-kinase 9-like isoform X1 [Physcomitrium patens]|eukprot:XP_024380770.1 phosphatidylinositol 4-phosphate 5-kinase 9-like isoform X1 [Physcomitrella patens]
MSEGLYEIHRTKDVNSRSLSSRRADSGAAATLVTTCSLGRAEECNVANQSGQGIRNLIFSFQRRSRKRAVAPEKAVTTGLTCMSGPFPHADTDNDVDLSKQIRGKHYSPRSCELTSTKLLTSDDAGEAKCVSSIDGSGDAGSVPVTGEKELSNGDFYVGTWQGSLPEGTGKYLWADGCMYEGEWGRGKKSGKGKISWPSGATYEGEFIGGYMHGVGTYMGTGGTTYKGQWSMNVKHGQGRKRYANGDVYEGTWKQGVQEGVGKYTWASGNEYNGEWRGGTMCGNGVLTWTSGDKFDGQWLDGLEHGRGVYVWADGSSYNGTWSRGLKDGKGVFYPAGTRDLQAVRNNDGGVASHVYHSGELRPLRWSRSRSISSERIPYGGELSKGGDFSNSIQRRRSMDGPLERGFGLEGNGSVRTTDTILEGVERGVERPLLETPGALPPTVVVREYVQGVLMSELVKDSADAVGHKKRRPRRSAKDIKRPGETIFKGHRSYDLMLNLQLGIRYTVGKITPEPRHEIGPNDFGPRASIHMNFPKSGTPLTPTHNSSDFKWKDYCPMVFRHLREMFKIDAADYMLSLCGDDALRELVSPGKSGSVFYLSHDDRFIIKTMKKAEVKVLLNMLAAYHLHVKTYDNTLITKFFGLHRIKPYGGQKVRFVVMGNMFCTELRIHRRFDLKGSSQGRSADKVEIDETTTLKDLDLDYEFRLDPSWRDSLLRQLEYDCKFLEARGIMDYSMLLGLHFRAPQYRAPLSPGPSSTPDVPPSESFTSTALDEGGDEEWASNRGIVLVARDAAHGSSGTPGIHIRGSPLRASVAGDPEVDLLLPGTARRLRIQLGVNMPARAERVHKKDDESKTSEGQFFGESHDVVLYFGIIDILQNYSLSKRIEHAYKACQFDSISISAVEPKLYSKRFQEFIRQIFPPTQL